jgi:hypothetical protein
MVQGTPYVINSEFEVTVYVAGHIAALGYNLLEHVIGEMWTIDLSYRM